jgi:O-acetyl-ADP-ribose deacetylase (regulator of RNase III)
LEDHLRAEHSDDVTEQQLDSVVKVGETSTVDVREKCPICLVSSDMEGIGGLQNHIANHLERVAAFSLPATAANDEADGGSSVASRGGVASTGSDLSQDLSQISFDSDADRMEDILKAEEEEDMAADELTHAEQEVLHQGLEKLPQTPQGLLSAEALKNLPDSQQNRMDNFLSREEDDEEGLAEAEEHLAEVEAFRTYLLSLNGAQNVRFYRRYNWWRGQVHFADMNYARRALKEFDKNRFPDVRMKQPEGQAKLNFSVAATDKSVPTPNQAPSREYDEVSVSSGTLSYGSQTQGKRQSPILTIEDIPTLRTLYRSKGLSLRDQSYAPNDTYNQVISFIRHDIARLKVDCIINSANRAMKITRVPDSLNHYIHKAAGPSLKRECKTLGRVKDGAVRITAGYDLPAQYIIHAARPQYSGGKGMGKLNVLTQCYRAALKTAMDHDIRTIAFPCLAAGGCGFPPRVAARIALQEVREFLDVHKGHKFQRIVFCVFSGTDENAYKDFLPVFFPPTHGDLESVAAVEKLEKDMAETAALLKVMYTRGMFRCGHHVSYYQCRPSSDLC